MTSHGQRLMPLLLLPAFVVGSQAADPNPPAPGFDAAGSDARAIALADSVLARLGGRSSWDATRYLTWRFFGGRAHLWDRASGDIRLEDGDLTVLMNVHSGAGRAWRAGAAVTQPDSLQRHLEHAYRAWINDSYWMFMPYKLKDTGVTLTYAGSDTTGRRAADILQLTFDSVGVTPQNKYHVWVDAETHLVTRWAFFADARDQEPRFVNPWGNWQQYGSIWLSDDRGRGRHTGIAVLDTVPAAALHDPAPLDWEKLAAP